MTAARLAFLVAPIEAIIAGTAGAPAPVLCGVVFMLATGLLTKYLPQGLITYAPTILLGVLALMLMTVVLIIAGFTYYPSVAQDQPFKSRFVEMAGISIGVAVVSFFVGILAKQVLGVDI